MGTITGNSTTIVNDDLKLIKDISLDIVAIVGKAKLPLQEILQLDVGSIVELDSEVGENIEILMNGKKVAQAEIVAVGNQYGLKLMKIL